MILIGHPRSGTTWIAEHCKRAWPISINQTAYAKHSSKTNDISLEWLDNNKSLWKNNFMDRVNFLEKELPKQYFLKIMWYRDIYKNELIDWFDKFYKDTVKLYIYNNNPWRMFLSTMYQDYTSWANPKIWKLKSYSPFNYQIKSFNLLKEDIISWLEMYKIYVEFDRYDVKWDYNDLTDEKICNYLSINFLEEKRIVHDYESKLKNLNEIKKSFYDEFKKTGLQIKNFML